MPNRSRAFAFYLLLPGAAAILALACTADLGGPVPPDVPAPPGEVEAADHSWESALAAAATTGQVTVLFDESQLTTLLRDRVAAEDDPAFESPVVLLRDGTIQIYGVGHQGPLRANVYLSITPVLTPDGALGFELSSATFGPFPLPEGFRNSLSALMTEMLSGPLGSMATGVRITAVAIDSGQLAIVGELR